MSIQRCSHTPVPLVAWFCDYPPILGLYRQGKDSLMLNCDKHCIIHDKKNKKQNKKKQKTKKTGES